MHILKWTTIAAIIAAVLSLVLVSQSHQIGEYSRLGPLVALFLFVSFFLLLWFPSMVAGLVVNFRKLEPAQMASHILVTVISGFVFVVTAIYAVSLISQR